MTRSYSLYFGAGRNLWNILQERSLRSSSCSLLVEEDGMLLSILEDRQTQRERENKNAFLSAGKTSRKEQLLPEAGLNPQPLG